MDGMSVDLFDFTILSLSLSLIFGVALCSIVIVF